MALRDTAPGLKGSSGSWQGAARGEEVQPAGFRMIFKVSGSGARRRVPAPVAPLDALRIDTDGRTTDEVADLIAAAARWPRQ